MSDYVDAHRPEFCEFTVEVKSTGTPLRLSAATTNGRIFEPYKIEGSRYTFRIPSGVTRVVIQEVVYSANKL